MRDWQRRPVLGSRAPGQQRLCRCMQDWQRGRVLGPCAAGEHPVCSCMYVWQRGPVPHSGVMRCRKRLPNSFLLDCSVGMCHMQCLGHAAQARICHRAFETCGHVIPHLNGVAHNSSCDSHSVASDAVHDARRAVRWFLGHVLQEISLHTAACRTGSTDPCWVYAGKGLSIASRCGSALQDKSCQTEACRTISMCMYACATESVRRACAGGKYCMYCMIKLPCICMQNWQRAPALGLCAVGNLSCNST
jgi:hypothetical protein